MDDESLQVPSLSQLPEEPSSKLILLRVEVVGNISQKE
jgi:hypothetical protein